MPDQQQPPALGPDQTSLSPAPRLQVRAAHEIPIPKDWQALQRGCVYLFQAELKDSHAQEYGRSGQKQRGIDILGRRDSDPDHFVGIQCKRILKPLTKAEIEKECRQAITIKAGLKEIILATTAPSDTHATDAAIEVEKTLRSEGHQIRVVLYAWPDLESRICTDDRAYGFFFPSAAASSAPQSLTTEQLDALGAAIAQQLAPRISVSGQAAVPADVGAPDNAAEDPALHARIDVFRDLFRVDSLYLHAESGLLGLLSKEDLSAKPWAKFRIETNLGSVAISLGRQDEAAVRFEEAFRVRPTDSNAIANLALARTIQGRYAEAMELAQRALESAPRSDQAISFLLQAAARSEWEGDPENLIPPDLKGTVHADMGLIEFLRKRNVPGWAQKTRELARAHLDLPEFRRADAIAVLALATDSDIVVGNPGIVSSEDIDASATEMLKLADESLKNGFADRHDLYAFVNNAAVMLRIANRQAECELLLIRAIPALPEQPQLKRLLALSQAAQGRADDAEATIQSDPDPESRLLAAELAAGRDLKGAIDSVEKLDTSGAPLHVAELKWRALGDLALRARDYGRVGAAAVGLRSLPDSGLLAELLELRRDAQMGTDEAEMLGKR